MAEKLEDDMLGGMLRLEQASVSKVGAKVIEGGDETSFQVLGMLDLNSRSLICYNPSTKKFHQMQKFDETMRWFSTVVIDDHIYAFYGDKSVHRLEYTDMNATWHRMADMNENHGKRPPAAVLDGFIYVIGSRFHDNILASNEKFDPSTNTWSHIKDMNITRRGYSVVACKGFIYSIGGCDESLDRLTSVERFDPRTGEWSHVDSMNKPVNNATAVELNDKICVINDSSVECYDPEQDRWTTVMTHDPLIAFSASVANGNIYVIDWKSDKLLMLNLTERKWKSLAILKRYFHNWQLVSLNMPDSLISRFEQLHSVSSRDKFASYESDDEMMLGGIYCVDEVALSAGPSKLHSESSQEFVACGPRPSTGNFKGFHPSGSVRGSSESKFKIWHKKKKLSLSLTKEGKLKEIVSQPPYVISHEQIIKPVGGIIVLPGCALKFKGGSFKNDCTVKLTLKFDKSQCPDEYFAICPFLDCEFSEPLLKPVSVELETICSATISESSDILVDVLHQKDGSKEWDHMATLPLSHRRVVEFECNDFSPLLVVIIEQVLARLGLLTFTIKGYLHTGIEGNILVALFVEHSLNDAQMANEYRKMPGMQKRLMYGPHDVKFGDIVKVELDLVGNQAEKCRFLGEREFSITIGDVYLSTRSISVEPVNETNIPKWVGISSKLFLSDNLVQNGRQTFNFKPDFSNPSTASGNQGSSALITMSGGSIEHLSINDMSLATGENPTVQRNYLKQTVHRLKEE